MVPRWPVARINALAPQPALSAAEVDDDRPPMGHVAARSATLRPATRLAGAVACLGGRVHSGLVLGGGAEHRLVQHDSAQEQVQIVLPCHAYAAV